MLEEKVLFDFAAIPNKLFLCKLVFPPASQSSIALYIYVLFMEIVT